MTILDSAKRNIDWFKSRGYLLGQRKDKFYIVHPQDGEKEFNSIWQAQQYVKALGYIISK